MLSLSYLFCNAIEPDFSIDVDGLDQPSEEEYAHTVKLLTLLNNKILNLELEPYYLNLFYLPADGVAVEEDTKKPKITSYALPGKIVRRVYLQNSSYTTKWVVDCDIIACMSCSEDFAMNVMGKHHCRSCGNIVCAECSPYNAVVKPLVEKGGSRICKACFKLMLKDFDEIMTSPRPENSPGPINLAAIYNLAASPLIKTYRRDFEEDLHNKSIYSFNENLQKSHSVLVMSRALTPGNRNPLRNQNHSVPPKKSNAYMKNVFAFNDVIKALSSTSSESSECLNKENSSPPSPLRQGRPPRGNMNSSSPTKQMSLPRLNTSLPSPSNATNNFFLYNQAFESPTAATRMSQDFIQLINSGEAGQARSLLRLGCQPPSPTKSTELLHNCINRFNYLSDGYPTIELLVEKCGAFISMEDKDGLTPLDKAIKFNYREVGELLVRFGADCLQVSPRGDYPLWNAIELNRGWVIELFQSNHEESLLQSGQYERIELYLTCLIIGGCIDHVTQLIESKRVIIDQDEANELYEICEHNSNKLKDPESTLALLRRLGANGNDFRPGDFNSTLIDESVLYRTCLVGDFDQTNADFGTDATESFVEDPSVEMVGDFKI